MNKSHLANNVLKATIIGPCSSAGYKASLTRFGGMQVGLVTSLATSQIKRLGNRDQVMVLSLAGLMETGGYKVFGLMKLTSFNAF